VSHDIDCGVTVPSPLNAGKDITFTLNCSSALNVRNNTTYTVFISECFRNITVEETEADNVKSDRLGGGVELD
jgi:hypothetical protein